MHLEMMKVKVGPDSMPRWLSWGVAKSLLLQILPAFESDKLPDFPRFENVLSVPACLMRLEMMSEVKVGPDYMPR